MVAVLRRNRKGSDEDITRLNRLGFSLAKIGKRLKCHPTSVTLRLKGLNVEPANTRRSFMDQIFDDLPANAEDNVADLLEFRDWTIKDYIRELIRADVQQRCHNSGVAAHV